MALEWLFAIFEFPREIVVNFLSNFIPEQILNPLFPVPYAKEISLVITALFALISIFVGIKGIIKLSGLAFAVVDFFEGISGGVTAIIIILGVSISAKLIKKILGIELGKKEEFGMKEEKMPEEEEFKMPEEKPEVPQTKMPEMETPKAPQQQQPQQKLCPYCGSPLVYVPQYQRYYCPRCRRYV